MPAGHSSSELGTHSKAKRKTAGGSGLIRDRSASKEAPSARGKRSRAKKDGPQSENDRGGILALRYQHGPSRAREDNMSTATIDPRINAAGGRPTRLDGAGGYDYPGMMDKVSWSRTRVPHNAWGRLAGA
jgi:hypothetical protein